MPRSFRNVVSLLLVPALLVTVSCSTDEGAFGPSPVQEQPTQLLSGVTGTATTLVLSAVDLLTCTEQPYAKASKVIGPEGGTIVVGSHKLFVPKGALNQKVQITAEQVRGSAVTRRCASGLPLKKRVVYTSELLQVLELLQSKDESGSRTVTGKIDHFSRYAVAY